jgi:hypothetical protein
MLVLDGTSTPSGLPRVRSAVDPFTGDERIALPGWYVIDADRPAVRILANEGTRPDRGVTYLGELTEQGLRRLGAVPFQLHRCSLARRVLVCATQASDTVVLRIQATG